MDRGTVSAKLGPIEKLMDQGRSDHPYETKMDCLLVIVSGCEMPPLKLGGASLHAT